DVTRALLNRKIPPLPEGDHIPAELRAICARALAPDPADRYPTAEAFQRDLEKYLQALREPCGAEELGAFLRAQFGDLRQATKKLIDFHIKSVGGGGSTPVRTPTGTGAGKPRGVPMNTGRMRLPSGAMSVSAGASAPLDDR